MGNQDQRRSKICLNCLKQFGGELEVCPDDGTLLRPIADQLQAGDIFADRYEIVDLIGDGGWGKVYKAKHRLMKRTVAIKMLLPHLVSSPAALKRFQYEAQAASALNHPNILTVYDFGISDQGLPYLVMDFLEGTSLAALLQDKGALSLERAIPIFMQACVALTHAHQKGVIHRDLKPPNIMLVQYEGQPDFLKLVDFGIAKIVAPDREEGDEGESEHLTSTGEIFGSPMYMSPEQCRGRNLDARSDIYSLGCVIYRTITGKPPFLGRDPMECMFKQVHDTPPSFDSVCPELNLPGDIEAVVCKAMNKEPGDRYQDMNQFREALDNIRERLMIAKPRPATQVFAVQPGSPEEVSTSMRTDQLASGSLPAIPGTTAAATQSGPKPSAPQAATQASSHSAAADSVAPAPTQTTTKAALPPQTETPQPSPHVNEPQPAAAQQQLPPSEPSAPSTAPTTSVPPLAIGLGISAVFVIGAIALFSFTGHPNNPPNPVPTPQTPVQENALLAKAKKSLTAGDMKNAQFELESALDGAAKPGEPPTEMLAVMPLLGELYLDTEQYDKARDVFERLLPLEKKETGANSLPVARTQTNLALTLLSLEQPDAAVPLLQSSKKIFDASSDKSGLADNLYGLARVASSQGKLDEAIQLLTQALKYTEQKYGANSTEAAEYMDNLAEAYQVKKNLKKAEELFLKSLAIEKEKLGADSLQEAGTMKHLAYLYQQKGESAKSEQMFKNALDINNRVLGPDSLFAADIQYALAIIYANQHHFADAEPMMAKALATRTKHLGDSSAAVARTKSLYDKIKAALKRSK